jgi:two-component system, NtrC family, response regulator AtoC
LLVDVRSGAFRADLYYRLAQIVLYIPPLRERKGEIEPLARHFLALACSRIGQSTVPTLTERAVTALEEYGWPGNIRELGNVMARSALFCSGDVLDADAVWLDEAFDPLLNSSMGGASVALSPTPTEPRSGEPASQAYPDRDRVLKALEACHGNQTQAAKLLGISRRTLVNRIESLGLPRPRKPFSSAPSRSRSASPPASDSAKTRRTRSSAPGGREG